MSYSFYLVDKTNKIIIRVGRANREEFEGDFNTLKTILEKDFDFDTFDRIKERQVSKLKTKDLAFLINNLDLLTGIYLIINSNLLALLYKYYHPDSEFIYIGEDEREKYENYFEIPT